MIIQGKVIVQPESEPVTLEQAKMHLRVTGNDEDTYITALIKVARRMCEHDANLSFLTQERQISLDRFPCREFEILNGPVQSIEITYVDTNGDTQVLAEGTDYTIDLVSNPARVRAVSAWPSTKSQLNAVTISAVCGWTNDGHDTLPEEIPQAILMQVATLFEGRQDEVQGATAQVNMNSRVLLDSVRVYGNANV